MTGRKKKSQSTDKNKPCQSCLAPYCLPISPAKCHCNEIMLFTLPVSGFNVMADWDIWWINVNLQPPLVRTQVNRSESKIKTSSYEYLITQWNVLLILKICQKNPLQMYLQPPLLLSHDKLKAFNLLNPTLACMS